MNPDFKLVWLGALLARQSCCSSRSLNGKVSLCIENVHPITLLHKDNSKTRKRQYKADTVHTCSEWKVFFVVISFLKWSLSWSHSVIWFVLCFQDRPWNCNKMPYFLQKKDARVCFFISFWWKTPNWWQAVTSCQSAFTRHTIKISARQTNFENSNTVLSWDENSLQLI